MKAKDGISCCPHCGSTSGFITNVMLSAERLTDWTDCSDVNTENYKLVSETKPCCADCGKSVRKVIENSFTK